MPFTEYRTTSNYGWRMHPIDKVRKFHAGIDLVKAHQAPIGAFTDGTVLYADVGRSGTGVGGFGNTVVIKDNKGAAHVYCHLDSIAVKKGQTVKQGQTIGRQGATGKVTGSHLHYEVRKKSSPSLGWTSTPENSTHNPATYLKEFLKKGELTVAQMKEINKKFEAQDKKIAALEKELGNKQKAFSHDQTPDKDHRKAMTWAKSFNLLNGENPKQPVTRQQLATILYRIFGSIFKK